MLRIYLLLTCGVVLSALSVVAAQHAARVAFRELEREQQRTRQLEVEWGQLQLELSTWAAHARVEKIARERLHMQAPVASQRIEVDY